MKKKGMALITILMMLIILVMLVSAMVAMNSNNLFYSSLYYNRSSALIAAESGVAYAIYALQEDAQWAPEEVSFKTANGKFIIKFFQPGYEPPFFSYNNLSLSSVFQPEGAFDNTDVYPNTVDLVVTGISGNVTKRIRVILGRSLVNDSGRCSGLVDVEAKEFRISKVVTPQDPSDEGTFHSNSSGEPNSHPLAVFVDSSCEVISNGGEISAVGDISTLNTGDTSVNPNSPPKKIPEIDIMDTVSSKMNSMPPSEKLEGGLYG